MEQNSKFKSFQLVHLSICIAPLLFLLVVCIIRYNDGFLLSDKAPNNAVLIVVLFITIISFILSKVLYKSLLTKIDITANAEERFQKYLSANIVRFALIEGATLFSIIEFSLSGSLYFLVIASIMIIINILYRPTKEKVIEEIQLNYREQEQLGF